MNAGKILGRTLVINGNVRHVKGFVPDMSADIYYEVVRMIDRKFLFLEDHLERLRHSLAASALAYPGTEPIKESLRLLVAHNPESMGNVRICVQSHEPGIQSGLLCYFVPYVYPEPCMYKSGVQVITYPHVRPDPGIKKWDDDFRRSVGSYIRDHGVYEAILMDRQKQLTEGSRSNLFFIDREGILITPPEKDVLPGITRKYVFRICETEKIPVLEKLIRKSDLGNMEGCFITGTSPKVLPVWQLDGHTFEVSLPLLQVLMERYERIIKEHLTDLDR